MSDEISQFSDFWDGSHYCFMFRDPRNDVWEFVFVWKYGVHILFCKQDVQRFLDDNWELLTREFLGTKTDRQKIEAVIHDLPESDDNHPPVELTIYSAILAFMSLGERMDQIDGEKDDGPEQIWPPRKEGGHV